jgi:tetratricopeptide (TPR) repeat protein
MSEKTVFISYRRDPTGKLFARSIKEALTHLGYDVFLDVDCLDAGKWATQILTQVPKRSHFLLLLTPGALDRCTQEDDWVRKELLAAIESGRNIVPIREESVDLGDLNKCCPECVKALFDYQIATLQHSGFEAGIKVLVERYIPPHKAPVHVRQTADAKPRVVPADISRIIKYAPEKLIGRETETALLDGAWKKLQAHEPQRPHILTFVALGGEGKTSLVAKWAADLAAQDWPGCDAVFAWSFYSQGTREQTAVSSDLFLAEALTFFGDATMAGSAQGAFEKGRRLAQLVGERRALLILDGLEPLQYAPTSPTPGELKDQGLAALLKGLAATSHGLCVVTTRYSIPDVRAFLDKTVKEEKLTRLSCAAGVLLLQRFGVKGSFRQDILSPNGKEKWNEFEKLVEDVKGHALTLNLLASYLRDAHAGDIRRVKLIKLGEASEEQGGHAFHVMDAYVRWFEADGAKGQRALAVLRLLGLFDRPATADCLNALWRGEAITGLTEPLVGLSDAQRNLTLQRLEDAKLLTVNRTAGSSELIALDAHPLLREYFARRVSEQQHEAWCAAHQRLYEHLCANTQEGERPTLEGLQPLYQAVAHGCQAGVQDETLHEIYYARICRRQANYSTVKLGAFGSDLGAVACFFEQPFSRVMPALNEANQAWLLNQAAFRLRALGRLTEALDPMRAVLERDIRHKSWNVAATSASSLSELEMTLGDVAEAVEVAEQSVTYADLSGDEVERRDSRTTHADALHQAGRRAEAKARFREAEQMQHDESGHPLLYSLRGFQYCDLLLSDAEREAGRTEVRCQKDELLAVCHAVSKRAAETLQLVTPQNWLLDIALDHLSLCRSALYAGVLEKSEIQDLKPQIDASVSGLRRAGFQQYLILGLLTRAWQRSLTGPHSGPDSAQSDLDEAWEIAERGSMKLHMADIHLYRARLFFRVKPYPWISADHDLAEARKLIEQCGYWRRKEELEDAELAILGKSQPTKQ